MTKVDWKLCFCSNESFYRGLGSLPGEQVQLPQWTKGEMTEGPGGRKQNLGHAVVPRAAQL